MIDNIDKMDGWKIEELTNLVFFQEGPGVRNNQYTDSGVKLLNVANLKDGNVYLENTERYISEKEAYGKYSHFLVDEGDLIIASSGIKVEYFDKKMGFVKKEHLPLCMNTSTIRFKTLDDNVLDIEYFAYFLKTVYFKKQITRLITGSAQLNFGPSHLKQIKIILPPIDVQKNIVEVLDKSKELIDKRKEQIEALDELVKSRFVEMFGEKDKFEYIKIENLVKNKSDIVDGPFGSNLKTVDYVNSGVRVIQINNIGECDFRDKNKRYVTEEKFNSLTKHSVIPGDIVVAKMGEPIGRACILPDYIEKAVIVADCMKIHPNTEIVSTKYLEFLLNTEEVKSQFKKYSQGSTRVRLNLTMLRQVKVLYPSIELQNEFADFVTQVDKLKFDMGNSLKELEDNFNSLMQKTFKGELFN